MKIWLLQTGEPLPLSNASRLLRTGILSEKLVQRGHQILWWTSAFEHQRKLMLVDKDTNLSISEGLTLRLLHGGGYTKNFSFARYRDHQIIAKKFRREARKLAKPDIIVASMPCYHLAYEGVRYAKCHNIPVIVDIRDLWPDIFIDRLPSRLKGLGRLVLAQDYARLRYLLTHADSLIAMSKGCLNWAMKMVSRTSGEADKVFYHGKFALERDEYHNNRDSTSLCIKDIGNQKTLIFIGTFGESYELQLIVEVAQRFHRMERDDVCFVLAGTGEKAKTIRKNAVGLPNVILPGWLSKTEVESLLKTGWAGLVACRSIENAIPNKSFEYLSASLPIISSLEGEMADLIEQHRIGLNYKPGDAEGLYHCIVTLLNQPDLYQEMSRSAAKFFQEYGNAEKIYMAYADHVERIAKARQK